MRDWAFSGVRCKKTLPLKGVLEEWCKVVGLTGRRWWKSDKDVPWWYNERANLSLLASAVSKNGGIAFEEFSAEKRKIGKTTGRFHTRYMGRVDLYFETKFGFQFNAEAKCIWSGATSKGNDVAKRIKATLKHAQADIRRYPPDRMGRLGIVFVRPYFRLRPKTDTKEQLELWLKKIEEIDADAMAWAFPNRCKLGRYRDSISPGVVVLIKRVHR